MSSICDNGIIVEIETFSIYTLTFNVCHSLFYSLSQSLVIMSTVIMEPALTMEDMLTVLAIIATRVIGVISVS